MSTGNFVCIFMFILNNWRPCALQIDDTSVYSSLLPGLKLEWHIFTTALPVSGHERVKGIIWTQNSEWCILIYCASSKIYESCYIWSHFHCLQVTTEHPRWQYRHPLTCFTQSSNLILQIFFKSDTLHTNIWRYSDHVGTDFKWCNYGHSIQLFFLS